MIRLGACVMLKFCVLTLAVAVSLAGAAPHALACGGKTLCREMSSCSEAHHYLNVCSIGRLDADNDGIPCESICGKDLGTMSARLKAQPFVSTDVAADTPASNTANTLLDTSGDNTAFAFDCATPKSVCRQMSSCEEATFYMTTCGATKLDGNSDGIPCNGLCR